MSEHATSSPSAPAAPAPTKRGNPVGLVAFILAIVGTVVACIPGAFIAGWVLLPVAFILAIIGLVVAGRRRGFALAGLIISVVGTIVGLVVFFAVAASSVDGAFGGAGAPVAPGSSSSAGAEKAGSRGDPVPLRSPITGRDYTVVVNSVTFDADDQVLAASPFNTAPPAGSSYLVVNVTVTYTGKASGSAGLVAVDY